MGNILTIESTTSTPRATALIIPDIGWSSAWQAAGISPRMQFDILQSFSFSIPFLQLYLHRYVCIFVALYLYLSHAVACFIWHVWHTHKCLSLKWAADCLFFLCLCIFVVACPFFLWLSFAFRFVYPSMTPDKKHATPPTTTIKTTSNRYKQWNLHCRFMFLLPAQFNFL